jgi:hypothetical protein
MDMWHSRISFKDIADNRRIQLLRFINFYSTVKPHKGLNNATPYEILTAFLINLSVNDPENSYTLRPLHGCNHDWSVNCYNGYLKQ